MTANDCNVAPLLIQPLNQFRIGVLEPSVGFFPADAEQVNRFYHDVTKMAVKLAGNLLDFGFGLVRKRIAKVFQNYLGAVAKYPKYDKGKQAGQWVGQAEREPGQWLKDEVIQNNTHGAKVAIPWYFQGNYFCSLNQNI